MARLLAIFFFLACSGQVFAEGACPPGYFPAKTLDYTGCAPAYDASSAPSNGSNMQNPPDPGPQWDSRWGAIAIDDALGKFGGVDGGHDVRKARKAAIKLCRSNGGKKCKIALEYYNQCGALAWGADKYVAYRGPVAEEVNKLGVASCNKLTSNCQIYYMGCSYPVRIN